MSGTPERIDPPALSSMPASSPIELPDFRNLGVILRIVLIAEGLHLVCAYCAAQEWTDTLTFFITRGVLYEPALLAVMLSLSILARPLGRLPYRSGVAAIVGIAAFIPAVLHLGFEMWLPGLDLGKVSRTALFSALVAAAILFYFNWRHRVLVPALAESRLMALQARIRPHFLFNSLNSVLGLIRDDPRRAERMLENLSELFRALMAEPRTLVPLARELELARAYTEIEAIRLGPRLRVQWQCDAAPPDALLPPLILQPLVENAIYHGVEPAESGGDILVSAALEGGRLVLTVRNPCPVAEPTRTGNRLALDNIRERLALHFDAEAELTTRLADGEFTVQVRLPYQHERAA